MSSNSFYNYSGSFIPGALARAEALTTEFSAVQAGFALLVVQGVDSGVANAYVVTTTGQPTGAYADGNTVEFKPLVTNTGASTLSVNAIPAVSILRFNGAALVAGDLSVGVWTTATYNSLYSAFTLVGPGQTAVIPGSISAAAPTHKVGLTAAGGSSTQAVPIDATYAIDQSISPTWTGNHAFHPVSGVALTATGVAGSYGVTVQGSATSGNSFGLLVQAGTTSADQAFAVLNTGASIGLFRVFGDGSFNLGFNGSAVTITGATAGNVTIAAPSSGTGLTVSSGIEVTGGVASTLNIDKTGGAATHRLRLFVGDGTGGTVADDAYISGLNTTIHFWTGGAGATDAMDIGAAGNVTIAAPSSGTTLTASGSAIQFASKTTVARGSGNNWIDFQDPTGESAYVGFGAANNNFYVQNLLSGSLLLGTNNTAGMVTIASTGAVTIAAPSSGTALTVNALTGTNSFVLTGAISGSAVQGNYTNTSNTANSAAVQVLSIAGTTALSAHVLFDISGVQDWYAGVKGSNSNWSIGTGSTVGGADKLSINTSGAVTIAAPTSGQALTVTGVANQYTVAAQGSATSGQSYGLLIQAGTTSADQAFAVLNTSAAAALFRVFGDGGVVVGNPTGGDQGAGTINVASGYYINNVPLPVNTSGSFTGTLTGCTTSPTATFNWERTGNIVTIYCAAGVTATSNAATMTITGTNAPSSGASSGCSVACFVEDNGTIQLGSGVQPNGGNLTFGKGSSASGGFTSSGTKGLPANWTITYCV
jgi:hypothetical protein